MSIDLRKYSSETSTQLIIGFITILVVVGDGLIYLFFGRDAAVMGLICLGFALFPVLVVWLLMNFVGWVVRKVNESD